jgi:predicted alpha/beta superfamily hydrolase
MFARRIWFLAALLVVALVACQAEEPQTVEVPVTVEVTRVVEVVSEAPEPETVEVTREVELEVPVEVEVTRIVEVMVEPEPVEAEAPVVNPMMPIEFDSIASSATGRDYRLTIALPMSYMFSEADYPTIYVTDGNAYAIPLATAAAQLGFGQEVPEFIVVGVDYGTPNPMEWLELRDLDMGLDGSENYLKFFEEELIPYIESNYRVDSSNRTLAGHSAGGNFALYGLLHAADTFSNFIASSPGGATMWVDAIESFTANQGETPAQLYMSVGDLDMEEVVADVQTFADALAVAGFEGLDQDMAVLDNETHLSARPRAFTNGLRWIFGASGE